MLYVSFHPADLTYPVWFALIPLFALLISSRGYLFSFSVAFLTGMVLWGGHIWWLNIVPDLPFLSFLVIVFYCSIYFGLFGLFFSIILHRTGWPVILVSPMLWVAIEFVRSNLYFLAIPWALLGFSQHNNLAILQVASVTSVYGISFLIVLVNAALVEVFLWAKHSWFEKATDGISKRRHLYSVIIVLITVLTVYLWGNHQIKKSDQGKKEILRASLIQANIPQNEKWNPGFRDEIMKRYSEMTMRASEEDPDIIIWPETATPDYLKTTPRIYLKVKEIVRETGIPLILGSSSHVKIGRERDKGRRLKNTAFLMDENGKISGEYNKMRLLPFGEYLPLEGRFPWPGWLVPKNGVFVPGTETKVFEIPQGRFGITICWENLFPDLFRIFVRDGAQFMVNLTNEAWFERTSASKQLLVMSVFRAVENHVSLLRAANSGISCIIDPVGRVRERVMDGEGNDVMVSGILTVSVPEPSGPTFYTRYGDIFALTCTFLGALFFLTALLPLKIRQVFVYDDKLTGVKRKG